MMTAQKDLSYSMVMAATPDRVWSALVDPAQLRTWFAEEVDVDAKVGGAYRFWGKHSLGVGAADDADQCITALEPEAKLAFTWTWCGVPTRVEITLEAAEWTEFSIGNTPPSRPPQPGCKLTVQQTFEGTLAYPRPESLADDHWRLAGSNLFAHLDGGQVALPDYTDPEPEVAISMYMEAPPETVFRTLTEPELLNQWIATAARVDAREGGGFDLGWMGCGDGNTPPSLDDSPMKILELVPGKRLTLSWPDWRGDASVPDQKVTWDLAPEGSGTRVEFRHTGFERMADRSDYFQGWVWFLERQAKAATSA